MKKNMIIPIVISVFISVAISIIISFTLNTDHISLSDFSLGNFNLDTETTNYTYSENTTTYSGKGSVICKDTNNDYIVFVETIDSANNKTDFTTTFVPEGKGDFTTYNSTYNKDKKPEYTFNIKGFLKFDK